MTDRTSDPDPAEGREDGDERMPDPMTAAEANDDGRPVTSGPGPQRSTGAAAINPRTGYRGG